MPEKKAPQRNPAATPKNAAGAASHAAARTPEQDAAERRRHRRIDLKLKARILRADGTEEPCLVINISAGGAMLRAKSPPPLDERVVVYIDDVGRFPGRVVRSGKHTFAVDYRSRRAKTQRTADTLTYAANNKGSRLDRRASPRIRHDAPTVVILENGETIACAILDISLTGASIAIEPRPPLGAHISVGKMTAKVVRRHDTGVGVVFTGPATHMEEVIESAQAPSQNETESIGAGIAKQFGKKGANA